MQDFFSLRENFFWYLVRPPPPLIRFLMVRPLVLRKSRTRSRQHLSQLKRSLYLCEDTVTLQMKATEQFFFLWCCLL